jgi:hypothetical protein
MKDNKAISNVVILIMLALSQSLKCNGGGGGGINRKCLHTVIRIVSTSAKFGICTVVGLDGILAVCVHSVNGESVNILASTSVPFRPTTVQVPNLALS